MQSSSRRSFKFQKLVISRSSLCCSPRFQSLWTGFWCAVEKAHIFTANKPGSKLNQGPTYSAWIWELLRQCDRWTVDGTWQEKHHELRHKTKHSTATTYQWNTSCLIFVERSFLLCFFVSQIMMSFSWGLGLGFLQHVWHHSILCSWIHHNIDFPHVHLVWFGWETDDSLRKSPNIVLNDFLVLGTIMLLQQRKISRVIDCCIFMKIFEMFWKTKRRTILFCCAWKNVIILDAVFTRSGFNLLAITDVAGFSIICCRLQAATKTAFQFLGGVSICVCQIKMMSKFSACFSWKWILIRAYRACCLDLWMRSSWQLLKISYCCYQFFCAPTFKTYKKWLGTAVQVPGTALYECNQALYQGYHTHEVQYIHTYIRNFIIPCTVLVTDLPFSWRYRHPASTVPGITYLVLVLCTT